jgi:hypothetical protein
MSKKKTTEEFIADAKATHGDKYDYSEVVYTTNKARVCICCSEHGEFWQFAGNHIKGAGCPRCDVSVKGTTESFISKACIVHGDKYDYSLVSYTTSKDKVTIICPEHGAFQQIPGNHLFGAECKECGKLAAKAKKLDKASATIVSRFIEVHGDRYDYSKVEYVKRRDKVRIVCPIHGEFWQRPGAHLYGTGCPSCSKSGFDSKKPGTLYYLKVKDNDIWKIGITNLTVEARFPKKDLAKLDVIWTKTYENGQDCYDEEQRILQNFKQLQYRGSDILTSGNTELFTEDISPYLQLLS